MLNETLYLISDNKLLISGFVLFTLLAWETTDPFFRQFKNTKGRGLHGLKNIFLQVLNATLIILFFVSLWAWASQKAEELNFGLLNFLELNAFFELVLAVLFLDLWTYWWHWMCHKLPILWRFHRVHHSDNKMDVTSANRFHFGEIFISSTLRMAVIFILGANLSQLAVYEALMFPIVQFHHANIRLPEKLDSFLRVFIPTPAMHKVHHSRIPVETDSNFSSLLSIWDRLFKSYRLQPELEKIELGLKGYDSEEKQSLLSLLKEPLEK